MAFAHELARFAGRNARRSCASSGLKRITAGLVAVACLALLCGSALQARADLINGHDYLYNAPYDPTDVTNRIVTINSVTYLEQSPGNTDGMVPILMDYDTGHIYDSQSNLIGFIYSAPP